MRPIAAPVLACRVIVNIGLPDWSISRPGKTQSTMTILVTGSAGFLGSWLVERLLSGGNTVVSVDNLVSGYADNVIQNPNHSFHEANILDLSALTELMHGCEVVYHTAALAYEGLSVFSPYQITQNIVSGSVSVMTAAIRNGVRRIVNCSSMSRYGVNRLPFRETLEPKPRSPYGVAKVAAEHQLNLLGELHGVEVAHVVPHNIIGPRQNYTDPYRNVTSIMINLMLQDRQPIIYGDGEQKRCFSYVTDVLFTLERLGECSLEEHGEVFNVGPDEQFISINELANTIADLLRFSLRPQYVPGHRAEVALATCSADKIRSRFGYETRTSLSDGLQRTIGYIQRRGPLPFNYHLRLEILNDQVPATWRDRVF